ncbi:amino acid permease/ SLC12A domain-containing protein [Leucosporidium creatinivorum]|uniref:Amino acid permease/ SLC12A domain-containing protein n=1 Tax=Leucosporidium creatinivorum TaxID=106004 RepID=A0A1Y2FZA1_9BASI|nr:amino acid permease/ SLC12A domain-containing protein [Leucosporidium creatinivorum]
MASSTSDKAVSQEDLSAPQQQQQQDGQQEGLGKRILGSKDAVLPRSLKPRHLTFLAIGGTIGTGIFLSVGSSVATAGAGGALVSYIVVGLFCFGVVLTLGEMSALIPVSGAFSAFGTRFVSPALGFTLGWSYWLQWSFSIPSELIAASVILNYWTQALNTWQWSLVIIVPVFCFQMLGSKVWGESEFWLSLIKVILIVLFIIVGLIYDWGGVIGHPGPGLSNFNDNPFNGGFAGTASSFTYAFYSFGGVELVALAAGEAAQPHKSIPRAIKATFARITIFYVMTTLVIGLCINYQDPTLFSAYDDSDVSASPITTVFRLAGFGAAVHVVNAVLLTAVLSATNSCFYASSRMMLALAREGHAFKILGYTTKGGVPIPALVATLCISFCTFITSAVGSGQTFSWLLNITGILALVQWVAIALINWRFRWAFRKQGRDLSDLPFKAPLFPVLNILAVILGALMFAANGWAATTYDDGQVAIDVVAVYIGLAYFLVLLVGYSIYHKITQPGVPLFVPWAECDFDTGAVWKRGGGALVWEEEKAAKEELKREKGNVGAVWSRVKESLY